MRTSLSPFRRNTLLSALVPLLIVASTAASAQQPIMDRYWNEVLRPDGFATLVTSPSGSLQEDESRDFTFAAARGAEYALYAVCDVDCSDIDLVVYGPDGAELAGDRASDDTPILTVRAAASGDHTVRVSMASCSVAPCGFWVRVYSKAAAGSPAASAGQCTIADVRGTATPGVPITSSLGAGSCVRSDGSLAQYYRLVLPERDSVTVSMSSSDFDSYLTLLDAGGRSIASDDDGGEGTDARLERTLPAGTYYVVANSLTAGGRGTFRLEVSASRTGRAGRPAASRMIDLASHSGWFTGPSSSGRCAYTYGSGGYRIDILGPATCYGGSEEFTGDDVRLSVTYRTISGANLRAGLSFGREEDGSKYVFSMDADGDVRLDRLDGATSRWTSVMTGVRAPSANTGFDAANMLSVELRGVDARLSVNGVLVGTRRLASPPPRNFTVSLEGGSAVFLRLQAGPPAP